MVGNLKENKGFVLLMAMLVSGLFLVIGMAIFKIAYIELILSSTGKASQKAFAAADSGLECALYWDRKYPKNSSDQSGSAFNVGSVTGDTGLNGDGSPLPDSTRECIRVPGSCPVDLPPINCAGQILSVADQDGDHFQSGMFRAGGGGSDSEWAIIGGLTANTFISFSLPDGSCSKVVVHRNYDGSNSNTLKSTNIFSHGYSSCDLSNPRTVERALQMTLE